ncbi:uncharacterized protein LOC144449148 [Glandiceps talaboti]
MEGEYNIKFKEPLQDNFRCLACNLALREPRQTLCGHRFCKECLDSKIGSSNEFRCPYEQCQHKLTIDKIYKDSYAKREIGQLKVICKCTWEGTWSSYHDSHSKEICELTIIKCSNKNCEKNFQRCDLHNHLENECLGRLVTCCHCQQQCAFIQKQEHESEVCQKVPVNCPYTCSEVKFPKEQLQQHLQDCLLAPTQCAFRELGCTFQGTRKEVSHHMCDTAVMQQHQLYQLTYTLELDLKCTTNKREITELQNEQPILESKFGCVVEDFGELRKQIHELKKHILDLQNAGAQKDEKIKHLEEKVDEFKEFAAKHKKFEKEVMEMRKEIQWLEEQNLKLEEEIKTSCRPPPAQLRMQMMKDGIDYLETKEVEKKRSNGCTSISCSEEESIKPVILKSNAHGKLVSKRLFSVLQEMKDGTAIARMPANQYAQFTTHTPLKNLSTEELVKQIHDLCGESAEHLVHLIGQKATNENLMKLAHLLILRANEEALVRDCELDGTCEGAVGDLTYNDTILDNVELEGEDVRQRLRWLEKRVSDVEKMSTESLAGNSYSAGGGDQQSSPNSHNHTTEITYSTIVKHNLDTSLIQSTSTMPNLSPVPRQSQPKVKKQMSRTKTHSGSCYRCKQIGHFIADCPYKKK